MRLLSPVIRKRMATLARQGGHQAAHAVIPGLLLAVTGCVPGGAPVARFEKVIGEPGHTSGTFHRPRGITFDPRSGLIVVVDWDGRIQKFTTNGEFRASWIMPDVEKGKPEDLCLLPNGHIAVADTHYSRIVEYTPDGRLVRMFGAYGREPGQFIYPVGLCVDPDGNLYVSEYGENDRIQKFAPDGTCLRSWGHFGRAPGDFQRPSGLAFGPDQALYVADAVNHRIQVFDPDGRLLRVLGREGTGPGEFRYPYDVDVRSNALYVLEYGNQRVQKLTLDGHPLACFGSPGRGDGQFAAPWRCTTVNGRLVVSDTDNGRVVVLEAGF